MAETGVPIQKRAAAWVSSIAVGMAMYFVFGSILTAAPVRERERVRRNMPLTDLLVLKQQVEAEVLLVLEDREMQGPWMVNYLDDQGEYV